MIEKVYCENAIDKETAVDHSGKYPNTDVFLKNINVQSKVKQSFKKLSNSDSKYSSLRAHFSIFKAIILLIFTIGIKRT